jgi:hypothetical protein
MPSIALSEDVYTRIRTLARFAGCSDNEVIRKLLEQLEPPKPVPQARQAGLRSRVEVEVGPRFLRGRAPRERGATVKLAGEILQVDSVRDLFEHVLRYLVKHGKRDQLDRLLPYKTSAQRYLIADQPVHPSGKPFYVPVNHGGLSMEAHKSYDTAMKDLTEFLGVLGVPFEYVSS